MDKIKLVEDFIGKSLSEFTIDDIETMIKSGNDKITAVLSDKSFIYTLLNITNSEEIKALYYHIVVSDQIFNSVNIVSDALKQYAESINLSEKLTAEVISKNNQNPATTTLLINLNKLSQEPLSLTTQYVKMTAWVQLLTLFTDIDIIDRKTEIQQTLNVIYKDLNNINVIFGLGVTVSILKNFVEPIDNIWIHKYNESIVDTSNTDYSEAITKLNTLITELLNKELNKDKNTTPIVQ